MQYHLYRERGFPIASGAMEGACKHLVKERIHRSAMRWSLAGCESVLINRTLIKNNEWEDFWKKLAQKRTHSYIKLKKIWLSDRS